MLRARSVPAWRSGARVTCAGEWGGAGPAEVPVPASCAALAAASAPVPGALGLGHLLLRFLVKLSQCGRGGADINPNSAGPAHGRCAAACPASPSSAEPPPRGPRPVPRRLLPAGALSGAPPDCSTRAPPSPASRRDPAPQKRSRIPGGPDTAGTLQRSRPLGGQALRGGCLRPPFPVGAGVPSPRPEALKGLGEEKQGKPDANDLAGVVRPRGNDFHLEAGRDPPKLWGCTFGTRNPGCLLQRHRPCRPREALLSARVSS